MSNKLVTKKNKVTEIKNKSENYKIQNTLLFHIFNRFYVVIVIIGLIPKRNTSMKDV